MKLIPLPADVLQSHPFLPFGVYAQDGRLLLPPRSPLGDERVRARLQAQRAALFVQHADYDAWRRGVAQAVQGLLQENAPLKQLARARPNMVHTEIPRQPGEEWEALVLALDKAVHAADASKPWVAQVQALQAQCRTQAARRVDEALFHLVYTGGNRTSHYSSRQALRCMLMAGEAARALGWDDDRLALLDHAALTMNAGAWRLHDQLVRQAGGIEDGQRALIASHPAEGERLLRDSGVADGHWLSAVRLHHDDALASQPLESLDAGQAAAALLRRVDRYSAMLSRRAGREPLSATAAAQQTCLGADGRPDPLGALMLKAVGLYPPGCFVLLASNERGIVLARGERANQPLVAALVNAEGMVMAEPRLRDTSRPGLAVRTGLTPSQLPVDPPLDKLQALRMCLR